MAFEAIALGDRLTIEDVVAVARDGRSLAPLAPAVVERVQASASWVASTVSSLGPGARAYYGINTGFGAQAGRTALDSVELTRALGQNLMASHAVGVGPYFDYETVRAAMLIRAQSLAQGYSGVRPLIIETLCKMIDAGIYPAIPEQGSLGASGDLAPLAHMLLTMCDGGFAFTPLATDTHIDESVPHGHTHSRVRAPARWHLTEHRTTGQQTLWRKIPGHEAMAPIGGPIELEAKEALALMNGATFSAALAALIVHDAQRLLDHAVLATAMTLEGMRGFRDPFYAHLHRARGHQAAEDVGAGVLRYVEGSTLLDPGDLRTDPQRVPPQDPYSVRCAPQVLGTVADTLAMARRWVDMEINAATDNPLIFLELERDYKTMSGGNFHGEPIAMAMDFLAIALTELASIAERRMFNLTDYHPDRPYGLSRFLIDEPAGREGLHSGLMMLQATAASLVSDCKALAHPDSVDSIPSSANQEDHVSMSLNAARHARDVVRNVEYVVALEIICAAQAIWLQSSKPESAGLCAGRGTSAAVEALRAAGVAPLTHDRVLAPDIDSAVRLVRRGALLRAAAC